MCVCVSGVCVHTCVYVWWCVCIMCICGVIPTAALQLGRHHDHLCLSLSLFLRSPGSSENVESQMDDLDALEQLLSMECVKSDGDVIEQRVA